jgi:hypothetical protein
MEFEDDFDPAFEDVDVQVTCIDGCMHMWAVFYFDMRRDGAVEQVWDEILQWEDGTTTQTHMLLVQESSEQMMVEFPSAPSESMLDMSVSTSLSTVHYASHGTSVNSASEMPKVNRRM